MSTSAGHSFTMLGTNSARAEQLVDFACPIGAGEVNKLALLKNKAKKMQPVLGEVIFSSIFMEAWTMSSSLNCTFLKNDLKELAYYKIFHRRSYPSN